MQAIITTFHGPTGTKGSRITAASDGLRASMPYRYDLSSTCGIHALAARNLASKHGWPVDRMHSAYLKPGTYVHILED